MLPQQVTHTRGHRKTEQKLLVLCVWKQAGKQLLDPHSHCWQRPACTALEHCRDGMDTPRLWGFRSSGQRMCQEGKGDLTDKKNQINIPWHGTKRCFSCLTPQASTQGMPCCPEAETPIMEVPKPSSALLQCRKRGSDLIWSLLVQSSALSGFPHVIP